MKILNYGSTAVFAFIFSCWLFSCSNNYNNTNPVTRTSAYPRALERAKKHKRYFIMHSGVDMYKITNVEVEKSKQQFTVQLNKVDSLHLANLNNPGALGVKHVHVYMKDSTSYTLDEPHTILLNKVARIESVK